MLKRLAWTLQLDGVFTSIEEHKKQLFSMDDMFHVTVTRSCSNAVNVRFI